MDITEFIEEHMPEFMLEFKQVLDNNFDHTLEYIEVRFFLTIVKKYKLSEDKILNILQFLIESKYSLILSGSQWFKDSLQIFVNILLKDAPNSIVVHNSIITFYIISFQIERVFDIRKKYPLPHDSPHAYFSNKFFQNKDEFYLSIEYYLLLAKCHYYLRNIEQVQKIYQELYFIVSAYAHNMAFNLMQAVGTHTPGCEVEKLLAQEILTSTEHQNAYLMLYWNNPELTTQNFALYQKRVLHLVKLLEEKSIPISQVSDQFISHFADVQSQCYTLDLSQDNLEVYRAIANLTSKNCTNLQDIYDFKLEKKEKLRIGVNISRYDKTEFRSAMLSLFKHFDKQKFELIFFAGKQWYKKNITNHLREVFDKVIIYNSFKYEVLRKAVQLENIDVFLSENICSPSSHFIFYSRMAPVQINIWDRLVSLACPHIDYFMTWGSKSSYKSWTDDSKLEHEKYAHLSHPYISPQVQKICATPFDMQNINIPHNAPYIFYAQSLRRLMVEDDDIIKRLLENNPHIYFIALNASGEEAYSYYYRWKHHMPHLMDRIVFLPKVPLEEFVWLIQNAACILGSFQGSDGAITNTTIFSQGQPIVAGYGKTFSNNLTKLHYYKMGIEGLIAHSNDEAVEICQRLLDDPAWKAQKSLEIKNNYHKLNDLQSAAHEMQNFILQAYDRALAGKAPEHWDHGMFEDDPNYVS